MSGQTTLNICHAGSLNLAFTAVEKAFAAQNPGVMVNDVSGGSVALAGLLASGLQQCDIFAAADYLDIDLLLKPAAVADFTIVFARGRMVLAYLESDPIARGVAAAGEFKPPQSIPAAASEWYRVLLQPGVRVSGSHPFLDPSGYRAHMMFQLAQLHYGVANLANQLMDHYMLVPAGGSGAPVPALGKDFNLQFIYEHSAAAAAQSNPSYRYVTLPDRIDLSTSANNGHYARASVTIPARATPGAKAAATIPATRVAWGLTIPSKSAHRDEAIAFVKLLLGEAGRGALNEHGPAPISPALVSNADYARLPRELHALVKAGDVAP